MLIGCQSDDFDKNEINHEYSSEEYQLLSKTLDIPVTPFSYGFGNEKSGIQTDHKGTLGRLLFYDKSLSSDGKVSCASCHQQSLAFSDDKAFSIGVDGKLTDRNSIALGGLRSFGAHYKVSIETQKSNGLFWDERAETIQEQLRQTINNPNEMNMDLDQIIQTVSNSENYNILYRKAFGSTPITEAGILQSIEVFINSISSTSSKLERDIVGELNFINGDQVTGSTGHELGLQLFKDHCNSCHNTSLHHFLDLEESERITLANNGLTLNTKDQGAYNLTLNPEDIGKFKVPGLLNIELTAPYMHDGRFTNLEEVVEHYSSGITDSPNLHPNLRQENEAKGLNFSTDEKLALVNFLRLLTDKSITTEEKWSNPFME